MNSPIRKNLLLVAFAILLCTLPALAQDKAAAPAEKHLGTWKLLSTKYGDAKDFAPYRDASSRLKLINATHFTWLEVDDKSKQVISSAGGTYKLSGNTYTETIEFAGQGMEAYLGKPQKFTIRVEGDKLHQSGELSTGLKIEEVWERVK